MSFTIYIAQDYDHMSEVAAGLVKQKIRAALKQKKQFTLGLATGRSPVGMYKHLAKAANRGQLDSRRLISFNLDEYVGLPGGNAQQRVLHPESYSFYMIRDFFGLLHDNIGEANVPWGTLIDQEQLIKALEDYPDDWKEQGNSGGEKGKAIVIKKAAKSAFLAKVQKEILDGYEQKIKRCGGIDLQVIGVGSKGHVAFHEAGIPFKGNKMLLVKLAENTIRDAVRDGHFQSEKDSPRYAVSMGVELVFRAPDVVLLASGERKMSAITRSIFDTPGPDVPLSYVQRYAEQGGNLHYVIDRVAATDILKRKSELKARGIRLKNISEDGATVMVDDIHFHCDPKTGLMT